MVRLCAVMLVCLLGSLISVQVEAGTHWSAGFHRLTFLDPLDLQPMSAARAYCGFQVNFRMADDALGIQRPQGDYSKPNSFTLFVKSW